VDRFTWRLCMAAPLGSARWAALMHYGGQGRRHVGSPDERLEMGWRTWRESQMTGNRNEVVDSREAAPVAWHQLGTLKAMPCELGSAMWTAPGGQL